MLQTLIEALVIIITISIVICITGRYACWCDIGLHRWEAPGEPCIDCGAEDTLSSKVHHNTDRVVQPK